MKFGDNNLSFWQLGVFRHIRRALFIWFLASIISVSAFLYLQTRESNLSTKMGIAKSQVESLAWMIMIYHLRYGQYPDARIGLAVSLKEDIPINNEIYRISGDEILDPWGHRYRYSLVADSFLIVSAGPDGKFNTSDDISIASPDLNTSSSTVIDLRP